MEIVPPKPRTLRKIAYHALHEYRLDDGQLRYLEHSENIAFRVDTASCGRYLVRLRPARTEPDEWAWWHSRDSLRSEMEWLAALQEEMGAAVPTPVRNQDGEWVTEVAAGPGTLECTLLRWVEGRLLSQGMRGVHGYRTGVLMARLHQCSARWQPPTGFVRPRWDGESLERDLHRVRRLPTRLISAEDRATFEAGIREVQAVMTQLGEAPDVFGLIHADLHEGNRVFFRTEARALDFSCGGFGHYSFDIASCLMSMVQRREFLAGYGSVRPLPENAQNLIEPFLAKAMIRNMAWLSRNPTEHEWLSQAIPAIAKVVRDRFLAGKPFLFGSKDP